MADTNSTNDANPSSGEERKQPLPLPPAPDHSNDSEEIKKLNAQGGTISLDHLGPMVVNRDGTMSRIANWAQMTQIERDNTLRILGQRNQLRLGELRKNQGIDGKTEEDGVKN